MPEGRKGSRIPSFGSCRVATSSTLRGEVVPQLAQLATPRPISGHVRHCSRYPDTQIYHRRGNIDAVGKSDEEALMAEGADSGIRTAQYEAATRTREGQCRIRRAVAVTILYSERGMARRTETRNLQYYILFSRSPRRLRSNWGAGGNIGIDGINRLDNQGGLARPVLSLVKKSPNRRSGFRRQSNRTRASGLGPASGDFHLRTRVAGKFVPQQQQKYPQDLQDLGTPRTGARERTKGD
jgi:hypothetical protein